LKHPCADTEYETVKVETGISDDSFIEIISGLEEGDIIIIDRNQSSTATGFGMGMTGMGGMPMGGMPGGMPSGGMGGANRNMGGTNRPAGGMGMRN
jgi:HlyD family secretion protein